MEPVTVTTALRSELETARELVEAYRALTREARRELEDERRENARLREQLAAAARATPASPEGCVTCDGAVAHGHLGRQCADCLAGRPPGPVVDHARLTIHPGGIGEVELSVCPACKQNRPEEQDWRGGVCHGCFVAGEVAPS